MSTHESVQFQHDLFMLSTAQTFGEGEDDETTLAPFRKETKLLLNQIGSKILPLVQGAFDEHIIAKHNPSIKNWDGVSPVNFYPANYSFKISIPTLFKDAWVSEAIVSITVRTDDIAVIKTLQRDIEKLLA